MKRKVSSLDVSQVQPEEIIHDSNNYINNIPEKEECTSQSNLEEDKTDVTKDKEEGEEKQIIDLSIEKEVLDTGQEELPMPHDEIRDVSETLKLGYHHLREAKLITWKFFIQDLITGNKVIQSISKQKQVIISFTFASTAALHVLEDTIKHEIAHILVGEQEKHNEKWRQMALRLNCNPNISCRIFLRVNANNNDYNNSQKSEIIKTEQPIRYKFRQYCLNGCWSKQLTRRPAGFANDLFKFSCNQCKAPIIIEAL